MNENCTLWTLRVVLLKALSLLRFFVALDKEMTRRHAQGTVSIFVCKALKARFAADQTQTL
ncbi:hypothetical protein [Caballeronia sp. 15711]|uniref:hypothetical protein n=1 Tax=Caballeronia sp. 15711 TaxID=3391029 RepID=UPI0039E67C0D